MDGGFEKALGSGKLELWLNGQACFDPVLEWCLHELTMNLADKSYSRITGLIPVRAQIELGLWHLDVGLAFPKSVLGLLVGVLIP